MSLLHFPNVRKLRLEKSVNAAVWQMIAFTLILNLSFPNIWEMKQTDMPLEKYLHLVSSKYGARASLCACWRNSCLSGILPSRSSTVTLNFSTVCRNPTADPGAFRIDWVRCFSAYSIFWAIIARMCDYVLSVLWRNCCKDLTSCTSTTWCVYFCSSEIIWGKDSMGLSGTWYCAT